MIFVIRNGTKKIEQYQYNSFYSIRAILLRKPLKHVDYQVQYWMSRTLECIDNLHSTLWKKIYLFNHNNEMWKYRHRLTALRYSPLLLWFLLGTSAVSWPCLHLDQRQFSRDLQFPLVMELPYTSDLQFRPYTFSYFSDNILK